jgi:EmrB/QacA subfamily drug resistance transporter
VFIAADDQTVVVTILPQIMLDMKVPVTELDRASWTITGYLLGYLAAMPLIGRISDVWGHRRLFIISMLLFMVGSVAVALTPSLSWLIATRVFQAVGAGALVPISIAIAGDLFPPGRRALPLGLIGASAEAGGVIGPLWGGIIIRYLDWRWVFWINIPLGAAVLAVLVLLLRPSPRFPAAVDYLGGGLIALSLASLTLGLGRIGAPDPLMVGQLALSGAAMALFVYRQRTVLAPLLPMSMFTGWTFKAANATHLMVGGALIIGMVTIPLMANTTLALTPLEGGLRLMRMTAAIPLGAIVGGILCQRMDYRVPVFLGLSMAAFGYWLMSGWGTDIADPALTIHLAVAGFGFGLLVAPIALAATESVGDENRGTAAAMVTATRMVGMTLGLAALAAWGSNRFQGLAAGIQLPFPISGETAAQNLQRAQEFDAQLTGAGMTLFSEFFLIAVGVCLVGLLPAALIAWQRRR